MWLALEVCPSSYSPMDYAYVASPNYRHHSSSQFWEPRSIPTASLWRQPPKSGCAHYSKGVSKPNIDNAVPYSVQIYFVNSFTT